MFITSSPPPSSFTPNTRRFSARRFLPPSPDRLWWISSGVVRTLTWSDSGNTVSLGLWGAGDFVGLPLSALDAYVMECVTDVEVRGLSPAQWGDFTECLIRHSQQCEQLLEIVRRDRVRDRLVAFLFWVAQRFGETCPGGWRLELRLPHRAIAEIIGTSRVTVTRLLRQLEEEGLLQRQRRHWLLFERSFSTTNSGDRISA